MKDLWTWTIERGLTVRERGGLSARIKKENN